MYLWLLLLNAETPQVLELIAASGVLIMIKAVEAFHETAASDYYLERQRVRDDASRNEAQVIHDWKMKVDLLTEENARQAEEIARLKKLLNNK